MPKYETCFRCGGANLEPGTIPGEEGPLIFVAERARLLPPTLLPVQAYLCMDCGTIELVADPALAKKHVLLRRE
jgi:hypothetical protein